MAERSEVLAQFERQAKACDALGSPFTATLCRLLAARLDVNTRFGRRILEWPGNAHDDNVALRACGALHALARSGWDPELTAAYPPHDVGARVLWNAISEALHHHDGFLTERLSSPPQTNEVARSALILGAALHVAEITRLPLELYEIGASAGLNLGFDEYRYTLGQGGVWGKPNAPLTIDCPWRGSTPPLHAPLLVIARHGCDLRPVDANNADDRDRLVSYVWADQAHRLQRVEAALKLAAAEHRVVEQADAATWLEHQFARAQQPGTVRVLMHTIVWQYLPADTRERLEATLAEAGTAATPSRPLARIAIEADGGPDARIDLTLWPTGQTVTLGRGDFHGRSADWA